MILKAQGERQLINAKSANSVTDTVKRHDQNRLLIHLDGSA